MKRYVSIKNLEELEKEWKQNDIYVINTSKNIERKYIKYEAFNSSMNCYNIREIFELNRKIKNKHFYKEIETKPLLWNEFVDCLINNEVIECYHLGVKYGVIGDKNKSLESLYKDFNYEDVNGDKREFYRKKDLDSLEKSEGVLFSTFLKENEIEYKTENLGGCFFICEIIDFVFIGDKKTKWPCMGYHPSTENGAIVNTFSSFLGKEIFKYEKGYIIHSIKIPEKLIFDLGIDE